MAVNWPPAIMSIPDGISIVELRELRAKELRMRIKYWSLKIKALKNKRWKSFDERFLNKRNKTSVGPIGKG